MRKSISLVLTLGMLCSSLSPVYSRVDAKLEAEIAREYQAFKGYSILGIKQPCRAIQYIYHLQEQMHKEQKDRKNTKRTADKITAVISEGAGVGGIDTKRQATEDERKIAYSALYEAIDDKASTPTLTLENSSNSTLKEHQKVVHSIYKTKKDHALPQKPYNFLTDEKSYNTLVTSIARNLKALEFEPNNNSSSSSKVNPKSPVVVKIEDDPVYQRNFQKVTKELSPEHLAEIKQIILNCPTEERRLLLEQTALFTVLNAGGGHLNYLAFREFARQTVENRRWVIEKFLSFTQRVAGNGYAHHYTSIITALCSLSVTEREEFVNLAIRFIGTHDDAIEYIKVFINALKTAPAVNRARFVDFALQRVITGQWNWDWLEQIAQVPNPADWEDTLRGLRNGGRNNTPQIQGMANQTVHDTEYEASIRDSVGKLGNRYRSQDFEDLETIKMFLDSKIDDLSGKRLLTVVEAKVAHHFFTAGFDRIKAGGNEKKIKQYLNLAWQALEDKSISRQLGNATNFTDKDIDDRFAGWLRSGPIDAQLAYKLDHLGSTSPYKTKADLLKAIEKDSSLITSGQSCVGGSYNRLIDALNLIHPDVELKTGAGNLKNIDLMNRLNFLKKQSIALLKEIYEEDSDKFNNLEELKKTVKEALAKDFEEELKKNHPTMNTPQVRTQEIDNFFNNDFADAMRQVTTLAPVYEYIDAPLPSAGLTKDVKQKLGDIKTLSFKALEESIKTHVKTLVTAKLQDLQTSPSDKEKTGGLTYALEQTGIIGLSVRKEMIKNRIEGMELNIKQIAKEFKEIEPKIVEQIKAEINQYTKSNPEKEKTADLSFLNTFSYFIQKTIQQKEGVKVEIGEIQQVWRNFMNKDTFKPLKGSKPGFV